MAYIELRGATLDLPIYDVQGRSLKKKLMRIGRRNSIAENHDGVIVVRALDNIDLRLESGDRVGLIGHNGAGKSTLLRMMAGIYAPTQGQVVTDGKTVPLLDINLGMDENSTGMQNIRLRGLLLGMSDQEIRTKQQSIAEFCELGDYLDLPLRTYSSGMRMRLAFAVSTAVDAEILLLDEVMGVGDASFMHKAEQRLADFHSRAEIVVFAMHANSAIRRVCNKALWMERGHVRAFGPVEEVVNAYEQQIGN
ncbi:MULTISPECIES: ABC transporter ATP-binding protein [Burkholderiaceae]|uniref:ABC transporter ATP-binding protein n=1 Tax=Burkholderiaceae TaxID=119060 RepID=UPI00095C192A|nr:MULTISPECIES: ABC transporter ATP-binding protein [Burkholderiaceae]MCF2134720.1 ABC transporter ATP-binding protein [Mycetohabitans sp. B3]MCG1019227.1 ABC transporter ATP-binding protein [Mycetohabitans sp. B4]MCG1040024.1 ABC transporter ATP-binding protein [Mycetohabitans sp. B7]SIT72316.1 lipopolysaccharide transport system ATP-binding protein [Burkholderia sp. b14]SIT72836.1 lipopolysaccharide transport system ATP-binding protein [Burkholderia sp. b13]